MAEAEPVTTFSRMFFSWPITSTRWCLTSSRIPSTVDDWHTVTTPPRPLRTWESVPPVNPSPYPLAAAMEFSLDSRVIPPEITSYASRRLATDGMRMPLRMQISTPLLVLKYPEGWAAETTQSSISHMSRSLSVVQSLRASHGFSWMRGRMRVYQNLSRDLEVGK